ncbi:MAG: manganese efflux pump MntP family protein [Anaerocolumna sp.]
MGIITIILLSFGVAMDAFAVSITNGLYYQKFGRKESFMTAFTFGIFQAGMPVTGYYIGSAFYETIAYLDHWIALFLLGAIGINMIVEGINTYRNPDDSCRLEAFTLNILIAQGIATSIDALAVGISFAVMRTNIILAVSCIGIITFFCSLFGTFLGKKFDRFLKEKAEIFGGCILIIIGLRIFIEHMFF